MTKINISNTSESWYSLNEEDILTVAEELDVKLNKAQINKVIEQAPDYVNWFEAIQAAINNVIRSR